MLKLFLLYIFKERNIRIKYEKWKKYNDSKFRLEDYDYQYYDNVQLDERSDEQPDEQLKTGNMSDF